ncbi:hypothetical protein SBV1_1750001 [Verrucomicrobia bacterium]|nr:hypothetical protein SBV1_1750001 [Verrucomicrobiota bacterium]
MLGMLAADGQVTNQQNAGTAALVAGAESMARAVTARTNIGPHRQLRLKV